MTFCKDVVVILNPGLSLEICCACSIMQPYKFWTHLTSWKYGCCHKTKVRFVILEGLHLEPYFAIEFWRVKLQNSSSLKDDSKLTMYTGDILFQDVTPANAGAFNGNAVEYLGGERKKHTTRDLWEFFSTWLWLSGWWIRNQNQVHPVTKPPQKNYGR